MKIMILKRWTTFQEMFLEMARVCQANKIKASQRERAHNLLKAQLNNHLKVLENLLVLIKVTKTSIMNQMSYLPKLMNLNHKFKSLRNKMII